MKCTAELGLVCMSLMNQEPSLQSLKLVHRSSNYDFSEMLGSGVAAKTYPHQTIPTLIILMPHHLKTIKLGKLYFFW